MTFSRAVAKKVVLLPFLLFLLGHQAAAQQLLQKKIAVTAVKKPLRQVLQTVEKQGDFYFSYNSTLFNEDSLVSVNSREQSVADFLDALLGKRYRYVEQGNHIILLPAVSSQAAYISGVVLDRNTGEPVSYATVYETRLLVSTMTNDKGYFRLPLKEKVPEAHLGISKLSYADTLLVLPAGKLQELTVQINPISYSLDSVVITPTVERTWLGNMFLSSRQRMNSTNLSKFFAEKPFQFSLTPGLGSHGRMGAQVVNRFSFNIVGGYTAGVEGFELAGAFNVVKKDMKYVQIAGVFNIVGGSVKGLQIAGLYNQVLDTTRGIQISGLAGIAAGVMKGIQVSGLYSQAKSADGIQLSGVASIARQSAQGIQIGGISNYSERSTGVQVSGLANISKTSMSGIQIAGILNHTGHIKGLQIGLINIGDSSEGYSIGLVNIIRKGYHKLSISTGEAQQLHLAYKTGNKKLYSILQGGMELDHKHQAYSFGYGLGKEIKIGPSFSLNPELSELYYYLGNWEQTNLISRLQLHLTFQVTPRLAFFAGPALSVQYYKPLPPGAGYKQHISPEYPGFNWGNQVKGWVGWNAGFSIF